MRGVLYLVHRIPYPPNKGDKIRSYHLLQYLRGMAPVYVGAFVDQAEDWQHREALAQHCTELQLLPLTPRRAKLRALKGLVTGQALSVPYYGDARMRAWVRDVLQSGKIDTIVVFSSAMAQYVPAGFSGSKIIDFVDVDSDKWTQYADSSRGLMRWLYRREGRRLLRYERAVARRFAAGFFVSQQEADWFKERAPESAAKIDFFNNGVDVDFFCPALTHPSPYDAGEEALVFTGAMDYWANVDAVVWFANDVFPKVRAERPAARFYIVGAHPSTEVRALDALPGVRVTGAVADVRPYLAHARLAVAPLRIARGIQNKVLEAMAMGRVVVASGPALEGIDAQTGVHVLGADDTASMARLCVEALDSRYRAMEEAARGRILERYRWSRCLQRFGERLAAAGPEVKQRSATASCGGPAP